MNYHQRLRLFEQHAAARLRRDTTETARIEAILYPDLYAHHQLFVFTLFSSAVTDHFGDDLDRAELAEFIAGLRQDRPDLHWLRAEALLRVCYGESSLYLDVPQSEQPALMWAVLALLIPPDPGDTTLTVLFDRAHRHGRELVAGVFETERLFGWADEPDPESETDPDPADEPPPAGQEEAR